MHIHQYEKIWLAASMVLIVFFIASVTYGTVGAGIAMIDEQEDPIDPSAVGEDERFEELGVEQIDENHYRVTVEAIHPTFIPSTIEVPANSTIEFRVTSSDVIHSFSLAGTNVNTMVIPGEVASMTIETGEPGSYLIVCNEYCGEFHHTMEGEFIVVDEDEFELEGDE